MVFDERKLPLADLSQALDADFAGHETLRQQLVNKTPQVRQRRRLRRRDHGAVFRRSSRPSTAGPTPRAARYRVEMLPTTCHVYFGAVDRGHARRPQGGRPLSEGISPVQGADRQGPTAVIKSAAKMDHVKTGGTLLNMKFTPELLAGEAGHRQPGPPGALLFQAGRPPHAVQRGGRRHAARGPGAPEEYRDLIVRVAGYSDYFCDLRGPAGRDHPAHRACAVLGCISKFLSDDFTLAGISAHPVSRWN